MTAARTFRNDADEALSVPDLMRSVAPGGTVTTDDAQLADGLAQNPLWSERKGAARATAHKAPAKAARRPRKPAKASAHATTSTEPPASAGGDDSNATTEA